MPAPRSHRPPLSDPAEELARAAQLHHDILSAISDGDGDAAEAASLALSIYLFDFTYATLPLAGPRREH